MLALRIGALFTTLVIIATLWFVTFQHERSDNAVRRRLEVAGITGPARITWREGHVGAGAVLFPGMIHVEFRDPDSRTQSAEVPVSRQPRSKQVKIVYLPTEPSTARLVGDLHPYGNRAGPLVVVGVLALACGTALVVAQSRSES
ncbi:MAG: hypothetical protein JF603_10075 [Acidobacteria bacterium]|nr:hypothetical protein [Acidobacteriota bacterium]